ncbi:MAG: aminoacyl-histidine dipeptidase [Ignavibacteria bacterium]|nr:aminoacyl-histidine dipeptidase [Ignavibacteria bacterium]
MARALAGIQPEKVWHYFEEICKIPHPSKKEEKLAAYIINWAKEKNFEVQRDKLGNICIRKPSTPCMQDRLPVIIQGHIDMVCEKNADVEFDFDNDPIQCYIDGDWVKAKGTTLGADNGIGVAMGMAILDSTDIPHPAVELLCTLDEETGLTGAIQLGTDLLKGKILINLDSEEDGTFTIGCAGGLNTSASLKYDADTPLANSLGYQITIKGLRGGHSGIEIHDGRGNAARLLNRVIYELNKQFDFQLSSFDSGSKHNAIPREAFAVIALPKGNEQKFNEEIKKFNDILKNEYLTKEPNLSLEAAPFDLPKRVMTKQMQEKVIKSFYAMPHGVVRMSPDMPGLVQTSTNFAVVETRENEIFVLTSQRSSVETEKQDLANKVRIALELGGFEVSQGDGYPAWQPNVNSPILKTAIEVYKNIFGEEPKIESIHAGLETGLIGEKYPGMDMLSFGPNLRDVHSPDERVQISTTEKCWKLLLEILKNIPKS